MKTKILLIIFAFSSLAMIAQSKVADKFFKEYAYVKAAELYQDALDNDREEKNRLHILQRLGDCHYNNSDAGRAAPYYKQALELNKNQGG